MQLHFESNTMGFRVQSCNNESVTINGTRYEFPIFLGLNDLSQQNLPDSATSIDSETLLWLNSFDAEVIIIGTGAKHQLLSLEINHAANKLGLCLEPMSTEAACRTYSLLVSENRPTIALLF